MAFISLWVLLVKPVTSDLCITLGEEKKTTEKLWENWEAGALLYKHPCMIAHVDLIS